MSNPQVMNRLQKLFANRPGNLLSIYFTAGFPNLSDTVKIAEAVELAGADIIEIGMPYSDPVADGSVIQESNQTALKNGMSIDVLFKQLKDLRKVVNLPVVLMGYLNPVLQYGVKRFAKKCEEVGIDGLILPDLPLREYKQEYEEPFKTHGLSCVFLISPQTSEDRIRQIDERTDSFIYMVSSPGVTGSNSASKTDQLDYFKRIEGLNLQNARLIGFGIKDKATFDTACQYAQGAIIGSAFIKVLEKDHSAESIKQFIHSIKK